MARANLTRRGYLGRASPPPTPLMQLARRCVLVASQHYICRFPATGLHDFKCVEVDNHRVLRCVSVHVRAGKFCSYYGIDAGYKTDPIRLTDECPCDPPDTR